MARSDAFNLGWKLAGVVNGELHEAVLDSYEAERHPVAEGLIRGTDFAYRGILHPSELRQRAARMIGPFLLRNSRVQGFMRETLEELSVSYPKSSLNFDMGGAKGPAPGERMLDAPVVRASDQATSSLWAEAQLDNWTLFIFAVSGNGGAAAGVASDATARFGTRVTSFVVTTDASAKAEPAILLDVLGQAHERYGIAAPTLYLVRPDTVVAARARLADWPQLSADLGAVFT